MFYVVLVCIAVLIIITLFAFPQFSPIPYFPSNMKDKENILKALSLKNDLTIIDLGAGDGVVVFEAANESWKKKLNTKFVALEINPVLIGILWVKWLLHPNRKNIKIVWGDMFKVDYLSLRAQAKQSRTKIATSSGSAETPRNDTQTIFYLYISPWLIEKVISRIQKQLPNSYFVSYFYPIKSLKKKEKMLKGVHNTYSY
ncbi:class I SAM-dependent methyltransferase [Candidatus Roizmanbacteria bacterium]|nr:class I SAM-dependent methyltransferase [Candidatus Roizmanbacteria bacterium]